MSLGETALDLAIRYGHSETEEVLRKKGEPYLNLVPLAIISKSNNCEFHFSCLGSPILY